MLRINRPLSEIWCIQTNLKSSAGVQKALNALILSMCCIDQCLGAMPRRSVQRSSYPPVFGKCNVLLDAPGPGDIEHVLVEGQHEHNQHEQRVEDGEEEDRPVPQLLEPRRNFNLNRKCA